MDNPLRAADGQGSFRFESERAALSAFVFVVEIDFEAMRLDLT